MLRRDFCSAENSSRAISSQLWYCGFQSPDNSWYWILIHLVPHCVITQHAAKYSSHTTLHKECNYARHVNCTQRSTFGQPSPQLSNFCQSLEKFENRCVLFSIWWEENNKKRQKLLKENNKKEQRQWKIIKRIKKDKDNKEKGQRW